MSWHSNAYCLARLLVVNGHLYWRAWTRRMRTSLRVLRRNPVVQVQASIVLVYCICMQGWNIDDRSCFVLLFLFVHFSCTSTCLASLVRLSSHDCWLEVLGHLLNVFQLHSSADAVNQELAKYRKWDVNNSQRHSFWSGQVAASETGRASPSQDLCLVHDFHTCFHVFFMMFMY